MKFISLFAGIGGFDLALTRQGHECVWANEWDKYAAQIYDKNFNGNTICSKESLSEQENLQNDRDSSDTTSQRYRENWDKHPIDTRDIRTILPTDIPDHDLLVGGFPCQAFSIAGKRRGFDDTRGTLFFEIARILREKHTRLFILENVKGLLSHDNGNTFKTIIATLDELGYDLQWQVLNSKNFGVPQNRERVFIIGNLRGTPKPKIFPFTQNNSEDIVLPTVTTRVTADSNGTYVCKRPTHKTTKSGGQIDKQIQTKSNTSNVVGGKAYSPNIRRLTPIECERLQGFPDNWTAGVSDTQRYKCCGNAVTVNVVSYLVSKI